MTPAASSPASSRSRLGAFAIGLLIGILGPLIVFLIVRIVSIDQSLVTESAIQITSADSRQGEKALSWEFRIQPQKKNRWDRPNPVGAFAHLESGYDIDGNIQSVDLREFVGLEFYASSNVEGLALQPNVFVGPQFAQYRRSQPALRIGTIWRQFSIRFDEFSLAPWADPTGVSSASPDLCCVTALGLDAGTSGSAVQATVFVDDIRLVRPDGSTVTLDDFERQELSEPHYFEGKRLRWKTGAQVFP